MAELTLPPEVVIRNVISCRNGTVNTALTLSVFDVPYIGLGVDYQRRIYFYYVPPGRAYIHNIVCDATAILVLDSPLDQAQLQSCSWTPTDGRGSITLQALTADTLSPGDITSTPLKATLQGDLALLVPSTPTTVSVTQFYTSQWNTNGPSGFGSTLFRIYNEAYTHAGLAYEPLPFEDRLTFTYSPTQQESYFSIAANYAI